MATPSGSGGENDAEASVRRLGERVKGSASAAGGTAEDLAGNAVAGVGLAGASLAGAGAKGAGAVATGAAIARGTGKGGWRSFVPPNARGKTPWKWRWLGVPLLLGACMLSGWWAWGRAESQLGERALVHLACEGIDTSDLNLDWSYRSVTVDGTLPTGVTADTVKGVIDNGSSNAACLAESGIDASDDPGVYDIKMEAAAGLAAAVAAPTAAPAPTAVPTDVPEPTAVPAATATPAPDPTATAAPEPTATSEPLPIAALAAGAAFDGQTVTLSGLVGDESQRDALVAAAVAAVGADNVIDELTIDPGEPSATSGDRVNELAQIISAFDGTNLVDGTASITDDETTYVLNAGSEAARSGLALPGNGTVNVPEPAAPAFTG